MASAPPTSIFFGSQPRSAHVPPKGWKSITATRQPASRTRMAAVFAAVPGADNHQVEFSLHASSSPK
jgi:hypothetical protein